MNRKKADISIQMVVMAVLALIVLVVLIFIFKGQVGPVSESFTSTGSQAKEGAARVTQDICGLFGDKEECEKKKSERRAAE